MTQYKNKVVEVKDVLQELDLKVRPITVVKTVRTEVRCSTCDNYRTSVSAEPCKMCVKGGVHEFWT